MVGEEGGWEGVYLHSWFPFYNIFYVYVPCLWKYASRIGGRFKVSGIAEEQEKM